ncbi:hypothetical protein [Kitasatospora albolonga]|uniref:hypothetical protein n=1 Tax=Kitasatospora albolonga TaxID=68173 RepID=UPI0035F0B868
MTFSFERNVPVSRMVMISGFDLHSDFHVGLEQPVFVRAGESIDYERGDVVVTAPSGEQRRYSAGGSHWICRIGGRS